MMYATKKLVFSAFWKKTAVLVSTNFWNAEKSRFLYKHLEIFKDKYVLINFLTFLGAKKFGETFLCPTFLQSFFLYILRLKDIFWGKEN